MNIDEERKIECSIPAQARVDIRVLAALDEYWRSEGINIKTMSQLISWSLDLFFEIMSNNDKLVAVFETAADANDHLIRRGLYQASMLKKSKSKILSAIAFDNLRFEGTAPEGYAVRKYKTIHNEHSVKSSGMGERGYSSKQQEIDVLTAEGMKIINAQDAAKLEESKARTKKQMEEFRYDSEERGDLVGLVVQPKIPYDTTHLVQAETTVKERDDLAKPKTEGEIEAHIDRVLKKDKEQLEQFKKM